MTKISIRILICSFLFIDSLMAASPNSSPILTNNPNCSAASFVDDPNIPCLNDPGEQFLRKVVRATELQESSGASCSNNGCPAKTANPFTPASYGSVQFTIETLVKKTKVVDLDLKQHGLTQAQIDIAKTRGSNAVNYFDGASPRDAPNKPPTLFTQKTNLPASEWKKIVYMKKFEALKQTVFARLKKQGKSQNISNFYKELTSTEDANLTTYFNHFGFKRNTHNYIGGNIYIKIDAWKEPAHGIYNSAFFSDHYTKTVLMGFFKDQSRFRPIIDTFIGENIKSVIKNPKNIPYYQQSVNESDADYGEKVASITACIHNSGPSHKRCEGPNAAKYWYTKRPTGFLSKWDKVKNFGASQACSL